MNKQLFFGLLFISLNYHCKEIKSSDIAFNITVQDSVYVPPSATYFSDDLVVEDSLYTTIISVDKKSEDEFALSVQMKLKHQSYFVSPNEKKDFSGKFTVVLAASEKIIKEGTITESPISKTDENHGFVKWVRNNTNYKQGLKVLSKENFEIYGHIQFTIEPRCTLENIPFILSYVDGNLSVKLDGC